MYDPKAKVELANLKIDIFEGRVLQLQYKVQPLFKAKEFQRNHLSKKLPPYLDSKYTMR